MNINPHLSIQMFTAHISHCLPVGTVKYRSTCLVSACAHSYSCLLSRFVHECGCARGCVYIHVCLLVDLYTVCV